MSSPLTPMKPMSFNCDMIWHISEIMKDTWIAFEDHLDPSNGMNLLKINVKINVVEIFDSLQLSSG